MKSKLILLIITSINALGLDLELITKVKIPTNSARVLIENPAAITINFVRNDGVFLFQTGIPGSSLGNQIIVNSDGKNYVLPPNGVEGLSYTNYVSQYIQDGELHIIQDVFVENIFYYTDPFLAVMTIGKNGFLVQQDCSQSNAVSRYDVTGKTSKSTIISQSVTNFTKIIRYDLNGNEILSRKFFNKRFTSNNGKLTGNQNNKLFIHYEIKDDYIYFYKLTDSDILNIISPNRITLGSSQNGSFTATINNPEQAVLNIQSSTNLIDWNTFKTIQNEPSLEIVVPANKPKEFIRTVE